MINQDITTFDTKVNSYELDFNYKLPINENINIELGYDGRFINDERNLNFKVSDTSNVDNSSKLSIYHKEYW